jgi:hypothetical protein
MESTNCDPALEVDSAQILEEPNLPLDITTVTDLDAAKAVDVVITDSLPGPGQEIEAMSQLPPLSPSQPQPQHVTIVSYAEDITPLPAVEVTNVPVYVNEGVVHHQDSNLGSSYHEVILTEQIQPVMLSSIPINNIPTTPIIQHPVSPNPSLGMNYFHTFQGEEEKLDIGRPYANMFSPQHSVEYDLPLPPPMSSPTSSFMTSPRGRGRPPGTFKRKDLMGGGNAAVPQNTYSIRPHREKSYQSLMSPLKKFKSESGSHVNSLPTASKKQGVTSNHKKKKSSASKRVEEAFDPKVYAVDNICKMVQEANERKITPVDLDALELLRIWAPKQDLERVVNELTVVRDKLLRRLVYKFKYCASLSPHVD